MILCYLLSHYLTLAALPEHQKQTYLLSDVSSCRVYPKSSWSVVDKQGKRITVTNGVIEVMGYHYVSKNKRGNK